MPEDRDSKNFLSKAAQVASEEISKIDSNDLIPPVQMLQILKVLNERRRQDEKWGGEKHDDAHESGDWLAILMSELGEVAFATLAHPEKVVAEEIVHVAAVAIAWLEAIQRRKA